MRIRETIDWGIDLGTTNSSIAIFEGRKVRVLKNKEGDEVTPSAVYMKKTKDNRIIERVGKTAKQRLIKDYKHVAVEFKRNMGLNDWCFEFPSISDNVTAIDLSAKVLIELIESAKNRIKEDIYSALITVPAAFLNPMYESTKKAGTKAGLKYIEILEEPIAAAYAYSLNADTSKATIWLAYDLGGGTFDAALVRVEDGIFSVFDHEGDPYLGGKDLDEAIIEKFLVPELPSDKKEKLIPWNCSLWWQLKIAAEEAKRQLATKSEYIIDEEIDGDDFVYLLTREQFNKLEYEIFVPTIEKCKTLLEKNKFTPQDVEKVILIGGSTLSPHLRKMIEDGLGIPVDFSQDPLTVVAKGAAMYAKDRRVPEKYIDEIRMQIMGNQNTSVNVNLKYPPTTTEKQVMVAGTLKSTDEKLKISDKWSVEIHKVDEGENVLWTSGKIPVKKNDAFGKYVSLDKGENKLKLLVKDDRGIDVDTNRKDFFVTVKKVKHAGGSQLARGIGIANANLEVIPFFKKNQPYPAEVTIPLKTTRELKKGVKGEELNIPIVEGNEKKSYLNWLIDTLKISSEEITTSIPKGKIIDVTIKMDESRSIEVTAYLADYDSEFSAKIDSAMSSDIEKVRNDLLGVKEHIESLEKVMSYDHNIKQVMTQIKKDNMINNIEKLVSRANNKNPGATQQAINKILELKKKLDPVLETGSELLRWIPHHEWCNKNINIAKQIIDKRDNLLPDWLEKFNQLLKDYEKAVIARDYGKTEEIAYVMLPELFRRSKTLRFMVGDTVATKKEGDRISIGWEYIIGDVV